MTIKKVGWIGTGVMGHSMCSHLQKAGYELFVYNRTKEKTKTLLENGATWCETPKEVAKNSQIVFSIVGFPKDVEEIYLGADGVIENLEENSIICDMTTSKPTLAKEIYQKAKEKNVHSLDAPVTGGDVGAKNGTLTIFVGGEEEVFNKIKPIFDCMGENIAYMGHAGSGQHAKMANQISVAATMIATVETLIYAIKSGLDPKKIIETVGSGSGMTRNINILGPRILEDDFNPGFYIKHFIKDMGIALEECEKMGINLPGLELAHSLYKKAQEKGYENLGTQALYKLF